MSLHRLKLNREPALRADGKPYAESIIVRADEVRENDVFPSIGTVVKVVYLDDGWVRIEGRLLRRIHRSDDEFTVIRRNWEVA